MTRKEKKTFVRDLIATVKGSILERIARTPDEWDGHELRQYIADCFAGEVSDLMKKSAARKRSYQNDVIVSNL